MTKCSCGQRDKDKCNKENGLNQGKMCLKEGIHIPSRDKTQTAIAKPNDLTVEEALNITLDRYQNYVAQELIQYITRSAWVDDAADYLIEIGVYTDFKHACEVVKSAVYSESDEFFETDPAAFVRNVIRKGLEE